MESFSAIIFIVAVIVILWLISKPLSSAQARLIAPLQQLTKKPRGNELTPGVRVVGLNTLLTKELQTLSAGGDANQVAVFLAKHRPSFTELDDYIASIREQYINILGKPITNASESEKFSALGQIQFNDPPEGFDFNTINKNELRALCEYDPQSGRLLDYGFIKRFGNEHFMENFRLYTEISRQEPVTLHIPKDSPQRKSIDALVNAGIAIQGRKIPLRERLDVLKFSQLREIADVLKLSQQYKRKAEITEALSKIPGAAVHLAMVYDMDDIFYLKSESLDLQTVEIEWNVIYAYAKLLCGSSKTNDTVDTNDLLSET